MSVALAPANRTDPAASQPLTRGESISHIANRLDLKGGELRSQSADVDVDDIGVRVEPESPDVGQQLLACAHRAAPLDEVTHQVELPLGQRDRGPVDAQLVPDQLKGC